MLTANKKFNSFVSFVDHLPSTSTWAPIGMISDTSELGIGTIAAELYMAQHGNFSFVEVSERSGVDIQRLRNQYETRAELLRSYYNEAWQRYVAMELAVPAFSEYSLAEKLTTLVFSLHDEFEHVPGFAARTYQSLFRSQGWRTDLAASLEFKISVYLSQDSGISSLVKFLPGSALPRALSGIVLYLIQERVKDLSTDKERSAALTDKATTLVQSALYTGILDHAIDLARYLGTTYYRNQDING